MSDLSHHIRAYTILVGILALGLWGMVWFSQDVAIRAWISVSLCISYALWGMAHHATENKLNLKIAFDYLAISFLGLVILLTLLFRA